MRTGSAAPIPPRASRRLPRAGRERAAPFDTLRDEIVSLTLAPGAVLARAELQKRFDLSSTPLRDALMRLQEEGLVEIFPQHATRVSRIDPERIRRAMFLRRAVEMEALRTIADAEQTVGLDRLREASRRFQALAELGDSEALREADDDVHRAIFTAAGHGDLWTQLSRGAGDLERLRQLRRSTTSQLREAARDHEAIVDALILGKGKKARAALADHLARQVADLGDLAAAHPDLFAQDARL